MDPQIHAYFKLTEDRAQADAQAADAAIADGTNLALTGIPYAAKDNILIEGMQATAASKILENYIATYTASSMEKLQLQLPVLLGKTNLDEFAMGRSTENSAFGVTKNPYDLERVAGGSSGGSAAAVASGQALFAFGTDTGGSVRQPASFCGIVGFKPTYGRISRYGLIAMGSSFDQLGIFGKTVEDVSIVAEAVVGPDENDSTALPKPVADYANFLKEDLKGLKIGIPKEYFVKGIDSEDRSVSSRFDQKNGSFGCHSRRGKSAAFALLLGRVLYYYAGGSFSQSRPFRRHPVWLVCGRKKSGRSLCKQPVRRIRSRGEAPHHDWNLCVNVRLC